MIVIFLDQNAKDLAEIANGIDESDFERIRAISHRMKTSVGFMSIGAMLETLNRMEQEARNDRNMQKIISDFSLLNKQSVQAVSELQHILTTI